MRGDETGCVLLGDPAIVPRGLIPIPSALVDEQNAGESSLPSSLFGGESGALPDEAQEKLRQLLVRMIRIREFELAVRELVRQQTLPGFVHLSVGQEATAVGVCSALTATDRLTSTHRGHGHALAKGCDPERVFAELMGRANGYSAGKGGSMHIVSILDGVLGTNGIVGGGIPIAVGSGLASAITGDGAVTVSFFGDGAANQGTFFESMNLAVVWALPIVFVCENNGFAEWSSTDSLTAGTIAERGTPFGMPTARTDGNDVLAVRRSAQDAVGRARDGNGPSLIEAVTYRTEGHLVGEEALVAAYRSDEEVAAWRDADPIRRFINWLDASGVASRDHAELLRRDAEAEMQLAASGAEAGAVPEASAALLDVYCGE